MTDLRNRIKELRYVKAGDLRDNTKNWRSHPDFQRSALEAVLAEVGIADALIAYERDGELTLIDGHLRKDLSDDVEWPVLVLDVNDAEADKLLATLDPLAGLAEGDTEMLDSLLAQVEADEEVSALLAAIQSETALEAGFFDDVGGVAAASGPGASMGKSTLVKIAVYVKNLGIVERAISSVGIANRGDALTVICSQYLEAHGTEVR